MICEGRGCTTESDFLHKTPRGYFCDLCHEEEYMVEVGITLKELEEAIKGRDENGRCNQEKR